MKYLRLLLFALLVINSFGVHAAPAAVPQLDKTALEKPSNGSHIDTSDFFPESELRPGQTGYALTVFKGSKIDRFSVVIVGVLHGMNNGRDFVVVKVTSGPSLTDNLNIAEGMSGSPVYIDHKLVGAIAASFPFGTAPIGLVTPISDMLDAWDPNLPSTPNISLSQTSSNSNSLDASALAPFLGHGADLFNLESLPGIRPLQTPVMVSGMSQSGINRLSQILGPYGMTPVAGGGMAGKLTSSPRGADQLVPGAALGCSLVQGDFDYTAIGTVTYRDKNRLIAFGHPFLGLGALDAPLTTVNIVTMYPSYQTSMKLGEPLANVGRVFQDRPYSIGGQLGVSPHMVPMTVDVDDHTNKRHKQYHFEIINHPLLTGQFVVLVAQQAILETHGSPGDAVATVTTTVNADQVGRITRTNVFYDSLSIEQTATSDLDSLVHLLSANSFYPLSIKGVDMHVTIDSSHATAQVDHIFVPKTKYKPGDIVNVGVVIKPYKLDPIIKTVSLKIPLSTPDGAVTLVVRGGGVSDSQSLNLGGTTVIIHSQSSSQEPVPANVSQLVRQYLDQSRNNDLVSTLQLPTTAVTVQGENLSLLPPTMSSVMRSSRSTGVHTARDEVKVTQPSEFVLTGSQSITLTVARATDLDTGSVNSTDTGSESTGAGTSDQPDESGSPYPSQAMSSDLQAPTSGYEDDFDTDRPAPQNLVDPTAGLPTPPVHTVIVGAPSSTPTDPEDSASPDDGSSTNPPKSKAVGRIAQTWRQQDSQDYAQGVLDNTTVTSANDIRLSLSLKPLAQSSSSYIWCLAQDKSGSLYAGTGDDGIVYHVDSTGIMVPFFRTGELEVTSLAYDSTTDTLYAGTSPHGVVFSIASDGTGRRLGTVGDKYVTALAIDSFRGLIYAATGGGSGDIFSISTAGLPVVKQFYASPETHLLSLTIDSSGNLYAGGAPDGVIYSISPAGVGKVIYDASQPNITALALDGKGNLYAGTSPQGLIYKITVQGDQPVGRDVKVLSVRPKSAVSGLEVDASGSVWISAGDTVYSVNPDDTSYTYAAPSDVSLLTILAGSDGNIYAGAGNTASIYELGDSRVDQTSAYSGTYTSPVHDARRSSLWGTITWSGETPPGTSLTLQTRTGDIPNPDETWSDWSAAYTVAAGQRILSPPGRFIQYKATLTSIDPKVTENAMPRLSSVSIYFLPRSVPPVVTVTSPAAGAFLTGTCALRWTALDADHDTLTYDVYYSSDGKTYLPIPKAVASSAPASPDVANKLKAELDRHPEIPSGVRQQMLQQVVGGTSQTSATRVTTNSYEWDTTTVPDGQYQVKIVASNYESDPTDPRTAEAYSRPITVANRPPGVELDAGQTKVNADKSISLHGVATSKSVFIKAIQYQIDKTDGTYSAAADDGLFDARNSHFTIKSLPQASGPHLITITAIDEAGNTASASTTVVVP